MRAVRSVALRNFCAAAIVLSGLVFSGCASSPEPPSSTVPTSEADATIALRDCLSEKGWDAQIEQGGVVVDFPEEQRGALQTDTDACNEVLDPTKLMSDEDRREFYDLQVETANCLAENGSPVEIPSWAVFNEGSAQWNPYVALRESGEMPVGGLDQLMALCPQHTYWDVLGS